ncbi:unnamed protein product [Oikopleura dioica]|uniref:Uncharacterized protein n=1 Tax=Oikopleura dioica TaxID=34765 RepID=E4X7Z3_OIKDI|nr:unnamed protein product [Oikopleura dioica]
MCDDLEMAEYVRTENYRFKKYWLLAKKAQLKEKTDKMKERINQFIFSSKDSSENTNPDVNIPELDKNTKTKEEQFVNPNLVDVDRKYKKMYEERLKNKLGLEENGVKK